MKSKSSREIEIEEKSTESRAREIRNPKVQVTGTNFIEKSPKITEVEKNFEIRKKFKIDPEMSTEIVKDGRTDGSKDSFGSGTESSQEFGYFINSFCLGPLLGLLFYSDQVNFLSHKSTI